ncbi:hypothetical protein [Atlantibacter subterraneus]|uniref:hypothetical protein n=1 Tax=Atlantibacter subterraneus TaxID=255519 RepID=UPI003F58D4CC
MLILGTHFNDTVELWLEAIRYAREGFQVEVLERSLTPHRKRAMPPGLNRAYRWQLPVLEWVRRVRKPAWMWMLS